jgi:pimeloyl-ACP methyl ester carboxylesterase
VRKSDSGVRLEDGSGGPHRLARATAARTLGRLPRDEVPRPHPRGGQSDILSRAIADKMLAENSNATLTEVPGVGHAPILVEPEAVKALESFLAD